MMWLQSKLSVCYDISALFSQRQNLLQFIMRNLTFLLQHMRNGVIYLRNEILITIHDQFRLSNSDRKETLAMYYFKVKKIQVNYSYHS